MFVKFSVIVLLIVSLGSVNCDGEQELTVTISFDSYSSTSINFFKSQLAPVFEELTKCVIWDFIPCSTSHIVNEVLQCCNGVMECQIDVLHACADHYYEKCPNGQYMLGKFFICMITNDAQFLKGEECAKSSGLDWEKLRKCKPSVEAATLCNNRYNLLNQLHETSLPGVIFNSRHNVDVEKAAIANFKTTVCERLNTMGKSCSSCPPC